MNSVWVAIIGGSFGVIAAYIAGRFALQQARKSTDTQVKLATTTEKIETVRAESEAKADIIKTQTDAETTRLGLLIDNLQKDNTRLEQKTLDQEAKIEKIRERMEGCLEERLGLKLDVTELTRKVASAESNYDALEAQLKNVREFNK